MSNRFERQREQNALPENVVRIGKAAAIGGAGAGVDEYARQREELIEDTPLQQDTIKGHARREVIVFQKVDKKKVAKVAARGAAVGAGEEVIRIYTESKRRAPDNPPLAA